MKLSTFFDSVQSPPPQNPTLILAAQRTNIREKRPLALIVVKCWGWRRGGGKGGRGGEICTNLLNTFDKDSRSTIFKRSGLLRSLLQMQNNDLCIGIEQTVEATVVWLVFRSEGRWFEPGTRRRVVSPDKKLYCTLPLSTQVYKWVPAIIMLGVTLRWTNIPSRGVGE